jgi:hypothetical protein
MDFSISSLMAGFVFGVFGWYLLKEGKKSGNVWHLGLGLGLMAYPYFVSGAILMWGIGVAGLTLAYVMRTRF